MSALEFGLAFSSWLSAFTLWWWTELPFWVSVPVAFLAFVGFVFLPALPAVFRWWAYSVKGRD